MSMDRLLAHLASDCPWWLANPRRYDPRCGARYTDLDRATPLDLPSGVPALPIARQRPPAREDHPQRKPAAPSRGYVAPMLSGWSGPTLTLLCRRCGRREVHDVATLMADRGDQRLTDLRHGMTADCLRHDAPILHERCDTVLVAPDPPPSAPGLRLVGERG